MINPERYKIKRFHIPEFGIRGKEYLTKDEELKLLNREVYIEEKVDGKFTSFKYPDKELIIFAEDLTKTHTIFYELPSGFLVFDIYHKSSGFFEPERKLKTCLELGLVPVPLIYHGKIKDKSVLKDIVNLHVSAFKTQINPKMKEVLKNFNDIDSEKLERKNFIEGIVVKFYEKGKLYGGKVVDPFFEKIIDRVGRYEDYAYKNVITPWDIGKYMRYFQKQFEKLNSYIPEENLEEGYKRYISNFDFYKKLSKTPLSKL